MAITINGTGSITGLTAGGLPDGSVTTDDLAANAVTAAKLAAGTGGKILNVWQGVFTGSQSFAPGSNVPGARADITDLSVTLTPASASKSSVFRSRLTQVLFVPVPPSVFAVF